MAARFIVAPPDALDVLYVVEFFGAKEFLK
jgi:hypothetical protein